MFFGTSRENERDRIPLYCYLNVRKLFMLKMHPKILSIAPVTFSLLLFVSGKTGASQFCRNSEKNDRLL